MKIIAIGGGEIGRPGYPIETTEIDREIIALSGKTNPKLLFLPTASSDSEDYVQVMHEHFGERLGRKVDELIDSKSTANAYKTYWKNDKYVEAIIKKNIEFSSLSNLLLKD
ncbi:MAG TPA: Type 1 glutamine amidotransferase-like domain-containing protein [Patescibacteria group bacterium]|nr:Type 1 glutamine amidotransferase-like domain-containing protein [Patescibacteria group bacterium]